MKFTAIFATMKPKQTHLDRLHKHVKRIMKRRKLNQKELAALSGLSQTDITRIVQGVDVRYSKGAALMDIEP